MVGKGHPFSKEKSPVTPNRNPTYNNRHYLVDIRVLTVGEIPKYGGLRPKLSW